MKKKLYNIWTLLLVLIASSNLSYSKIYPINTENNISIIDSVLTTNDSISNDSIPEWLLPCIDCFVRIEAVRKDKEECIKDSKEKDKRINYLVIRNEELYNKYKSSIPKNIILGAFLGFGLNYLIK